MHRLASNLARNDIIKVLSVKDFSYLMISELFSQTAFNMQNFVLVLLTYTLTQSNTAVSLTILAFTTPALIFSTLAGVLVDRWDKKKVLLLTNFARGGILLFFLFSWSNLFFLYFFAFVLSIIAQFFIPAEAPMIPTLVKKELLIAANAVFSLGIFASIVLGFVLSGPLLLLLGPQNVFIFLSVLYVLSSLFIFLIRKRTNVGITSEEPPSTLVFIREVREALLFVTKTGRVASSLLVLTISQTIIFTLGALGPGYFADVLGIRVENISFLLLIPAAIGILAGAFFLGTFEKRIDTRKSITLGFLIVGLVLMFFPFADNIRGREGVTSILLGVSFFLGLAISLIYVPANATIQAYTKENMRGKIYGFLSALVAALSLFPVLSAGIISDIIGVESVLFISGLVILLIGFFRMTFKIK